MHGNASLIIIYHIPPQAVVANPHHTITARPLGTNIHHEPSPPRPDPGVPALKPIPRRNAACAAACRTRTGWKTSSALAEPRARITEQVLKARSKEGEVGGALPVVEGHGVGGDEEGVEGCVAVGWVDGGGGSRRGGLRRWWFLRGVEG